jgi:predicted Zn-dependent protease
MNSLMRKLLILVLVMAAVAVGGWFGRKAYKRATERRLMAEARQYMDKGDFQNGGLSLRRALQVNPMSAQASDLLADLFETEGVPVALSWRIRAAQLSPGKPEYRLSWAKTAIQLQNFNSAREALDGLTAKEKDTADYHKLAGALAWGLKNGPEAERHYTEAMRLEPKSKSAIMNLATIHLSSTNDAVATAGRLTLEEMTTNADLRLPALRLLETEANARKSFSTAVDYGRRIIQEPRATLGDRISYAQALRNSKSPDFVSYLTSLQLQAVTNSAQAFALGRWMAMTDGPTNALRWLQSLPASTRTDEPVCFLVADCMAELRDWKSLVDWVGKSDWGEVNYYRLALESLGQRSLKQSVAAKTAWQNALRLSRRRLDRLSHLAQFTSGRKWAEETTDLLREITLEFPKEKWAAELLMSKYYQDGDTKALAELLTRIYAADPSDSKLKNNLANIFLLRKSDLEQAHRMAREAYNSAPENPFFASTYAYSLLLQEKCAEASIVIGGVKTNFLQIPEVAAYYGVVEARSGHKDLAREPLSLAAKATLLPEEKDLVRSALSQL